MRAIRWLILALLPGLAQAQVQTQALAAAGDEPAEPPPAGFPSRQYIDSRGCVFLRDDSGGWSPRLARDGTPICGYPPTRSVRGLDGGPRLPALDPNAGRSSAELLAEALSRQIITGLRPGELASDPRPMEHLPDLGPEPASSAPAEELRAALATALALRRGMAGALHPNRRLCELLGYDDALGTGGLGDATQGYCDSLSGSDLLRFGFMRPVGSIAATGKGPAADVAVPDQGIGPARPPVRPPPRPPAPAPAAAAPSRPDKSAAAPATGQGAAAPVRPATGRQEAGPAPPSRPAATPGPGMIPADARYVQIGSFADPGQAEEAARIVAGLGYRVLRGRQQAEGKAVRILLAGPFADRESIVRAIDGIRKAGFRDAFPR